MELASGMHDESAAGAPAAGAGRDEARVLPEGGSSVGTDARVDPETSTAMLRRCTALATRARVELLSPGPRIAAAELAALLREMEHWDPASLEEPDPTMSVLAAAALQDLAERLQDPVPAELETSAQTVLGVLREIMTHPRVDVPA